MLQLATMLVKQIQFIVPIQPSQEEGEKDILNTKHKLSIDGVQTPITSKKIALLGVNTYQILFWKILMNMQNWIRQRKLQRKGETYYFLATQCQSSLTQSFPAWNIALLKELLSHRQVLMKIPIVCGSAFLKMAQFWQVSAAVWQAWYRHVNMSLQYCIILKARKSLVITRPAQAKSKNGMYVCIGKGKIFTYQLK